MPLSHFCKKMSLIFFWSGVCGANNFTIKPGLGPTLKPESSALISSDQERNKHLICSPVLCTYCLCVWQGTKAKMKDEHDHTLQV